MPGYLDEIIKNLPIEQVLEINDSTDLTKQHLVKVVRAKSLKIVFDFIVKVNIELFPNLFVFTVQDSEIFNSDEILVKNNLFNKFKLRPLILELKNDTSCKLFYKDQGETKVKDFDDNNSDYFTQIMKINDPEKKFVSYAGVKKKSELCVRFLNLFGNKKGKFLLIKSIIESNENFKFFCEFIDIRFDATLQNETTKSLLEFRQGEEFILTVLINNKRDKEAKFIIYNFPDLYSKWEINCRQKPSNIAYISKNEDIFTLLIENDFPFPPDYDKNFCIESEVIKNRIMLHDKLENNEGIIDFIIQKKFSGYMHDFDNITLLEKAIKSKNLELIAFLKSQGFKQEFRYVDKTVSLSAEDKKLVNEMILNNAMPHEDKYVKILASKSRILNAHCYDINYLKNKKRNIEEYLTKVSEITTMKKILRVVVLADLDINIYFNFSGEYLHNNLFVNKNIWGLTYPIGNIIIGAKKEKMALQTLAHEFLHFAMLIIYNNDFLPYRKGDKVRIKLYEEAYEECEKTYKEHDVSDKIVKRALSGTNKYTKLKELIVRVPEMYVRFKDDVNGLNKCIKSYYKLFEYYNKYVIKDLENYDLETHRLVNFCNLQFGRIEKFDFKTVEKIKVHSLGHHSIITTNIPILALCELKNRLKVSPTTKFLFINPKKFPNILKFYSNIVDKSKNLTLIIDFSIEDLVFLEHLLSEIEDIHFVIVCYKSSEHKVKTCLNNKKIKHNIESVDYSWCDLTLDSQLKIKSKNIRFQKIEKQLLEILQLNEGNTIDIGKIFKENFLDACLSTGKVMINETKNFDDFHIARKFKKKDFSEAKPELLSLAEYNADEEKLSKNVHYEVDKTKNHDEKCFIKYRIKTFDVDEDKILYDSKANKIVMLSAISGEGKTQILKKVQEQLQMNLNLVYFISLQEYIKDFENIQPDKEINFKEFAKEVFLKHKSKFERELFDVFYEHYTVVILFDGFDEVSQFHEIIFRLIESYKGNAGSQIWITTRSYLENELRKNLNLKTFYTFAQFTKHETIDFITKYLAKFKLSEKHKKDVEVFKTHLLNAVGENFISVPQLLKFFADACFDEGKINTNFSETASNFKIYHKVLEKKIEIWSRQRLNGRNTCALAQLDGTSISEMHQYYALKSYGINTETSFGTSLHKIWEREQILECGLITHFDDRSISFQHESLKEFYVAKFVLENFATKTEYWLHYPQLFEVLLGFVHNKDKSYSIVMFVNEGINETGTLSNEKIETFAKILNEKNKPFLLTTKIQNHNFLYDFFIKIFGKMNKEKQIYLEFSKDINNAWKLSSLDDVKRLISFFYKDNIDKICDGLDHDVRKLLKEKLETMGKQLKLYSESNIGRILPNE